MFSLFLSLSLGHCLLLLRTHVYQLPIGKMTDISYGGETQHLFKSLNIWWQYFLIADTVQKFSYNSSHECMCVCECVCLHDHVGRAEMYFAYLQRRQPSPHASDKVTNDYRLHVPLCASSFSFLLMCHDCSPLSLWMLRPFSSLCFPNAFCAFLCSRCRSVPPTLWLCWVCRVAWS